MIEKFKKERERKNEAETVGNRTVSRAPEPSLTPEQKV
jgi:hypothetical protein